MRSGIVLFLFMAGVCLSAQSYKSRIHYKVKLGDTEQLHQLILLDYTKLLGTAMAVTNDSIYFQLRSGAEESAIPLSELRYLGVFTQAGRDSGGARNGRRPNVGRVGFDDMTYERTALPYQTKAKLKIIQLLVASVEWNLNDNLQLGVGLASPLVFLTNQRLRFTVAPQVHLGVSNQTIFPFIGQGFNGGAPLLLGDLTGILTLGDESRFLNLGTGIFYNTVRSERNAWGHRIGFGGRLSEHWHLYGEGVMVLSRGERRFGPRRQMVLIPTVNAAYGVRRHRWKFGLATFLVDQEDIFPLPVPYLGYSYYWGN